MLAVLNSLLNRVSPRREPLFLVALALGVAYTAYRVLGPEGLPLSEVITEDYLVYLGGLATTLYARLQVFSRASVEKAIERALAEEAAKRTQKRELG